MSGPDPGYGRWSPKFTTTLWSASLLWNL